MQKIASIVAMLSLLFDESIIAASAEMSLMQNAQYSCLASTSVSLVSCAPAGPVRPLFMVPTMTLLSTRTMIACLSLADPSLQDP
jgi:hypothetical protein